MARIKTIFISSAHTRLGKERKAVRDVSERLGSFVLRVEARGATSEAPLERTLAMVRKSDAVVIVVGADQQPHPRGIPELEYEEAVRRQIPTFVFFTDDSPLAYGSIRHGRRQGQSANAHLERSGPDVIDALASVVHDAEDAKMIVRRAGFPQAHIPEFKKPIGFWTNVVDQAIRGRVGLGALVEEAAKQFPHNEKLLSLRECIVKALAQAAPPNGSKAGSPARPRLSPWHRRLLRERVCEGFSGVKDLRVKVTVALARWMISSIPWYQRPFVLLTALIVAAPGWINLLATWSLSAKGAAAAVTLAGVSASLVLWEEPSDTGMSPTGASVASVDPTVSVQPQRTSSRTRQRQSDDDGDGTSGGTTGEAFTTADTTGGEDVGASEESGPASEAAKEIARILEAEAEITQPRSKDVAAELAAQSAPVGNVLSKQAKAALWRVACEADTFYEHASVYGFVNLVESVPDDAQEQKDDDDSYVPIMDILARISGVQPTMPGYKNFTHWNPEILLWIAQNLLPERKRKLCRNISAEILYENTALPFMRGAAAVVIFHAETKPVYPREASYSWGNCETGICAVFYTDEDGNYSTKMARFLGGGEDEYTEWGFVTDSIALDQWNHFWIRRCLDGTMDEFASLLSIVIHRYDSKFAELHGRRLRKAASTVAGSACAQRTTAEPATPVPIQTVTSANQ